MKCIFVVIFILLSVGCTNTNRVPEHFRIASIAAELATHKTITENGNAAAIESATRDYKSSAFYDMEAISDAINVVLTANLKDKKLVAAMMVNIREKIADTSKRSKVRMHGALPGRWRKDDLIGDEYMIAWINKTAQSHIK